ncbi:MAG TPA: hypothetical protein VH083_17680 [Myxococcales bacterium]|nr:hypothetical protein [Myxococcales bacterium]
MKLVLLLTALMLAIGGVGFYIWRSAPEPQPCALKLVQVAFSRDGKTMAEAFELRCETSTAPQRGSVTTHVTLRRANAPEPARSDVFVANGAVPVQLSWEGAALQIASQVRPVAQESSWHGLAVRVKQR